MSDEKRYGLSLGYRAKKYFGKSYITFQDALGNLHHLSGTVKEVLDKMEKIRRAVER